MSDFTISSQPVPRNAAVLKMDGGLEDADFDAVLKEFRTILDAGVNGVVLDVSGLTKITSAGLGAMVELGRTLAARQGKLVVAAPPPDFMDGLELLGIKSAFTFVPTVPEGKKIVSALGMSTQGSL